MNYMLLSSDIITTKLFTELKYLDINTLIIFINIKSISKDFFKNKKIKTLIIVNMNKNNCYNLNKYISNRKNICNYYYFMYNE